MYANGSRVNPANYYIITNHDNPPSRSWYIICDVTLAIMLLSLDYLINVVR